jgi:hypothetical protein
MVTGPMPRKPNATSPNAKIGAAKRNFSGMIESSAGFCEKWYETHISTMMQRPIQKAEKLPATKPDRMLSEAPPCLEQFVTSFTWPEFVLTNTLVNSGMSAPAMVPQLMITESTHQRPGWMPFWCASRKYEAANVIAMETAEVIQTRWVSGAS